MFRNKNIALLTASGIIFLTGTSAYCIITQQESSISPTILETATGAQQEEIQNNPLFDTTLVHEISIDMTPETYQEMIQAYQSDGEKEYFPVNITIDGTLLKNV